MKVNKKGFWASLFPPKPNSDSRGGNLAAKKTEQTATACYEDKQASDKSVVKDIKVLGPGCPKCKTTYQAIEKVIKDNNLDARLSKIEDITEIMSYNIIGTPAVVVDGIVRIRGHVPSESEIKQILGI